MLRHYTFGIDEINLSFYLSILNKYQDRLEMDESIMNYLIKCELIMNEWIPNTVFIQNHQLLHQYHHLSCNDVMSIT